MNVLTEKNKTVGQPDPYRAEITKSIEETKAKIAASPNLAPVCGKPEPKAVKPAEEMIRQPAPPPASVQPAPVQTTSTNGMRTIRVIKSDIDDILRSVRDGSYQREHRPVPPPKPVAQTIPAPKPVAPRSDALPVLTPQQLRENAALAYLPACRPMEKSPLSDSQKEMILLFGKRSKYPDEISLRTKIPKKFVRHYLNQHHREEMVEIALRMAGDRRTWGDIKARTGCTTQVIQKWIVWAGHEIPDLSERHPKTEYHIIEDTSAGKNNHKPQAGIALRNERMPASAKKRQVELSIREKAVLDIVFLDGKPASLGIERSHVLLKGDDAVKAARAYWDTLHNIYPDRRSEYDLPAARYLEAVRLSGTLAGKGGAKLGRVQRKCLEISKRDGLSMEEGFRQAGCGAKTHAAEIYWRNLPASKKLKGCPPLIIR